MLSLKKTLFLITLKQLQVAPHDIFRVDKDEGLSVTSVLPNENAEELNGTEHNDHSMGHEEKVSPHFYRSSSSDG